MKRKFCRKIGTKTDSRAQFANAEELANETGEKGRSKYLHTPPGRDREKKADEGKYSPVAH